ncbi:MAG: enoyl-CoA hydratase-related protein [Pseudomonadota bacterium]
MLLNCRLGYGRERAPRWPDHPRHTTILDRRRAACRRRKGKAWVHTEYGLLANLIVAGENATFIDAPHFAGGIIPGDGIFTTWSYYAGPAKTQAFLLDPQPISAAKARDWGIVSEVVADGTAVARAHEIAHKMIDGRPALTLRNTRIHFIQPLKERIVREVGYGLALEGASATALVKQLSAQPQA